MKKINKNIHGGGALILLVQTFLLTAITLFCVIPFSCRVSEEGIIFVGGDYNSPVLEDVNVLDEKTVQITFSEKVKLRNYTVSQVIKEISDSSEHSETIELSPALKAASGAYGKVEADCSLSEDGCVLTYSVADRYEVGKAYEIFSTVEDRAGNSLTFCVPFCGYNACIPKLIMTELLVKHDKNTSKNEFVEILALTSGNLAGLELVSGSDGEKKKFVMPPVEVETGEILLIHLRSLGEGCLTETDNLDEASAAYAQPGIRDIWAENEGSALSDTSDVIILRKGAEGEILDAFMYNDKKAEDWKKPKPYAEKVYESGIYDSVAVEQAFPSSGASSTKSFQRTNAADLRAAALNGVIEEYPVKYDDENWALLKATAGTL